MKTLSQIIEWIDRRLYGDAEGHLLDARVREAFHRNANEQAKLRGALREIAKSVDPIEELAKRIRGEIPL